MLTNNQETQDHPITIEALDRGHAQAQQLTLDARNYMQALLTYEPKKTTPQEHKKRMEELSIEAAQAAQEVREELRLNFQSFPAHFRKIILSIHQF